MQLSEKYQALPHTSMNKTYPSSPFPTSKHVENRAQLQMKIETKKSAQTSAMHGHHDQQSEDGLEFIDTEAIYEQELILGFDDNLNEEPFGNVWDNKNEEIEEMKRNEYDGKELENDNEDDNDLIILTPMASLKLSLDALSNSQSNTKTMKIVHSAIETMSISVTSENGTLMTLVPLTDRSSNTLLPPTHTNEESESQRER